MADKKTKVYEVAVCNYMEYRPFIEAYSEEEARIIARFLFEENALIDGEFREMDEFFGADILNTEDTDDYDEDDYNFFSKNAVDNLGFNKAIKDRIDSEIQMNDLQWEYTTCISAWKHAHRKLSTAKGAELERYQALYDALDVEIKNMQQEISKLSDKLNHK